MKTTAELLPNILTAVSEQPTKVEASSTKDWADWLNLKTHNDPELENMVAQCAKLARAFRDGLSPRWLAILGGSGVGKTHCARKLWKRLSASVDWSKSQFVHCEVYWPKFISDLRSGHAYERLADMANWPVLFLDDIGAERDTTGFASEQLNALLGMREGRWTIITSNLGLGQLGGIDPRMADRVIRQPNIFAEINTASYALRKINL